jgi:site-specific DNA-methyltransferase (adenine-specific)
MIEIKMRLILGDCIQQMASLEDASADLILTDPPYGTTRISWDSIIPLEPMWNQLNRIIKPNGAIALFAGEPFTSVLISSNLRGFKYRWTWDKQIPSGMMYARFRPMQQSEDIVIFSRNGQRTNYFPIMVKRDKPIRGRINSRSVGGNTDNIKTIRKTVKTYTHKNPTTLLRFPPVPRGKGLHPTQKPVPLLEYLIKTYTQPGGTVLDFTMGSGSTGVAALRTGREFIGIELDENYFQLAEKRLNGESLAMASDKGA